MGSSSEKYNPITGTPIPVHAPRRNTSAIFGGSPGNIEYMFIPPSATTRPTKPTSSIEKRRSISRESLRRPSSVSTEGQPESDEYSSISDVSECSSEVELRERTRTSSGSFPAKTRKRVTRSVSSRLPVSASKPCVMKRAHSFTRGTGSCVPRGQASNPRGPTNNPRESNSTSDLRSQPQDVGGTSKIPRKPSAGSRGVGPQSSRIPFKRADVNSNVAERATEGTGNESTVNKRTAPTDSKTSGITVTTSSKQPTSECKKPSKSEPAISKQNSSSGIPVKGGKIQKHSGSSRIPSAKQDGTCVRDDITSKSTEQNKKTDKQNDDNKSAMQDGKSTLKREGTGDELRVAKSDVTKSKLPRKSNIPKSNVSKTSQQKTRNGLEVETKVGKLNQTTKNKATPLADSKTNISSKNSAHRDLSTGPAEAANADTSNTLQRSDSGFDDTDSVSSKEDAATAEPGNEFSLSRENSKSKIPMMSRKSRAPAKPSRAAPTSDEKKRKEDTKKAKNGESGNQNLEGGDKNAECGDETETGIKNEKDVNSLVKKAETDRVTSENNDVWVYKNGTDTKSEVQDGGMNKNGFIMQRGTKNVPSGSKENILNDTEEKQNGSENKTNMDIKMACEVVFTEKQMHISNEKQTSDKPRSLNGEITSNTVLQNDTKTEVQKQSTESLENEQKARKTNVKQSPRKPPRLLKLSVRDECEKKQDAPQETLHDLSSNEVNLKEDPSLENFVIKPGGGSQFEGAVQPEDVSQPYDVEVDREEEPPRKFDNCMQCRMEQSILDGEDMSTLQDDPGFRQYPTFISPRKSLVMCKHHAKQKNETEMLRDDTEKSRDDSEISRDDADMSRDDTDMSRDHTDMTSDATKMSRDDTGMSHDDSKMSREPPEKPLISMKTLPAVNNDHKSSVESFNKLEHQPELSSKNLSTSYSHHESHEVANTGGIESPLGEKSRKISLKSSNAEKASNTTENTIKDYSDTLKTPNAANSRQVEAKTQPGPKGSHSPLLALSRDKKFASNTKPTEDIKTALSLEWDDTGTELNPPNFSDDDEDFPGPGATEGDLEGSRRPSVKLMNTNEALDKLKVIQSLIMKEAESRGRKESEESAGKYAVDGKKTGTESAENTGKIAKTPRNEVENFSGKFGFTGCKEESSSNPVSPTLECATRRKISSPTIWDRITDNSAISQDQTTELLNETLAKLKASPKLSSNAFARRTLSSRSLPGSKHASKEQLLSDGERPVYVYTSSWMNASGKNSRGSSLSLCSANRSLPSSRQNLTKESFNGLKRSESAAGRMEKPENGKRLEPKTERKEFRLSDFDEINLSDDGISELKNQKTPKVSPLANKSPENDGETARKPFKKSKRRKKSKNTAATLNNVPEYGVSMDELADGKTTCKCGAKGCVIS